MGEKTIQLVTLNFEIWAVYKDHESSNKFSADLVLFAGLSESGNKYLYVVDPVEGITDPTEVRNFSHFHVGPHRDIEL